MMTALNTLNESMQGHYRTMIDFADKVRAFKEKLQLWYIKVENKNLASFPILNRSIEDLDPQRDLITSVPSVILEHLHTLRKKLKKYIPEKINNYMWIKNPFTANVADLDVGFVSGFQEQLIDLKNDSSLQLSFGELSLPKFCCQVANEYPISYEKSLKIINPFPSSYLYEMRFSALAFKKEKYRNLLDAEHLVMLSHDCKNLLKQNGDKCCLIKVLLFVFCFFVFFIYLGGSQLFLQTGFLNDFGSQKKMVEKHRIRRM